LTIPESALSSVNYSPLLHVAVHPVRYLAVHSLLGDPV